jgi:chromosomal replication initiation ATPase DnaA
MNITDCIDFCIYLTGHDEETIRNMYFDWIKCQLVRSPITTEIIAKVVFNYFKINIKNGIGTSRKGDVVKARQISMYLARKKTDESLIEIGSYFEKNHGTVIWAISQVQNYMNTEPKYLKEIIEIDKILTEE